MRVVVALGLLVVGCGSAPTSVLVRVVNGDTTPSPNALTVDVFDPHGRIADVTVAVPALPGTLIVRGLPDADQVVRVVVRGGGLLGGERVQTRAHAQASLEVALHGSRLDSDADGVPDDLDDCPSVIDPLQTNAAGDGPGDACLADAGAPDLAVDAATPPDLMRPPSLCSTISPPVALCDGFEAPTIAAHWSTSSASGGASVGVDTSRSYRGSSSLKMHHDAVAAGAISTALLGESQTFPMSDFFMRAFMYLPSPLVGANETVMSAEQSASPYKLIALEIDDQGKLVTFTNVPTPTVYQQSPVLFPLDRWVCVEWEVVATASGTTHLWLDEVEVTALNISENLAATPPLDTAQLVLQVYQPAMAVPAHDVWFDEVIVDGARVGCTK